VDPRSLFVPPTGTWAWALVKKVAEGAARGMNYLHCGNPAVLHRDLKSANILLDDSYNPKVCDFGLSRIKAHENSMTANCGTVQWMAPEILANEPYAEPADVYSYGIILWELLTRECPYEGMSSIQAAMAVLNQNCRPEIPNWCPTVFADLVRQCIEKDPSNRPTFAAILSRLDSMPRYSSGTSFKSISVYLGDD
jgi:serine/threonine protein kinase